MTKKSINDLLEEREPKTSLALTKEGLEKDFPQALELMQFVWDRTNVSVELRGLPPSLKYQFALDILEGRIDKVPKEVLRADNPYISRNDVIPEDKLQSQSELIRDEKLPPFQSCIRIFGCTNFPHPDKDMGDRKVQVTYRRYADGSISYEIEGPIERFAVGSKKNRFGQEIPDKYSWIDPRTGETAVRMGYNHFTPIGSKHYTFLTGPNGGGVWDLLDRELPTNVEQAVNNPWA